MGKEDKSIDIIDPVIEITVGGETIPVVRVKASGEAVEVSELRAFDAIRLYKLISKNVSDMTGDVEGNLDFDALVKNAERLIGNIEDIAIFMIEKSTKRKRDWIEQLGQVDCDNIISAAVQLNFTPELIASKKKLGKILGDLFGKATKSEE